MNKEKIKRIFEDESILVVNKPSGLVVHSDGRTEEESLVDWLREYVVSGGGPVVSAEQEHIGNPHTLDSGRYFNRWGILNRLDRDTSGIILIAKNGDVFENLHKQFLDRSVKKEYTAEVWATEKFREGELGEELIITEPISRHKKDPRIWVCGTGVGERATKRDAKTLVEVLEQKEKTTILKLVPITGRTHQLRLHCRFIMHPIVGDTKYGINGIINEHSTDQIKELLENLEPEDFENDKNSRLKLHAGALEFVHPETWEKVRFVADCDF